MAQQLIDVGTTPNDGTGDPLRTATIKINDNFTELYGRLVVLADQAAYDALTPDASTFYFIPEA